MQQDADVRRTLWGWYLWHEAKERKAQETLAVVVVNTLAESVNKGKK